MGVATGSEFEEVGVTKRAVVDKPDGVHAPPSCTLFWLTGCVRVGVVPRKDFMEVGVVTRDFEEVSMTTGTGLEEVGMVTGHAPGVVKNGDVEMEEAGVS